jgi:hypothetical protein
MGRIGQLLHAIYEAKLVDLFEDPASVLARLQLVRDSAYAICRVHQALSCRLDINDLPKPRRSVVNLCVRLSPRSSGSY